jgi:hypothetical protein
MDYSYGYNSKKKAIVYCVGKKIFNIHLDQLDRLDRLDRHQLFMDKFHIYLKEMLQIIHTHLIMRLETTTHNL